MGGRYDDLSFYPERALPPPAEQLHGSTATITANGSAEVDTSEITGPLWISVFVAGSATGTTPTLNVYWDQADSAGNWINVPTTLAQLTSGPNFTFAKVADYPLTLRGRIRWVVGGTNPSFAATTITVIGR